MKSTELCQPFTDPERAILAKLQLKRLGVEINSDGFLSWNSEERDKQVLNDIWLVLLDTADLSDAQFRMEILPQIINFLLDESGLFKFLNSDEVKVSEAHQGESVVDHTFEAVWHLDTSLLEQTRHKAVLRLVTICHDIGKIIHVNGKVELSHARVGEQLVASLIADLPLEAEEKQLIVNVVREHHGFGDIKQNKKLVTELCASLQQNLVSNLEINYLIFVLLTLADPLSNSRHRYGSIDHLAIALRYNLVSFEQVYYLSQYISAFFQADPDGMEPVLETTKE